jgi:hypothetical protein
VHGTPLDHKEAEDLIKATRQILDLAKSRRARYRNSPSSPNASS